MKQLFKFKLEDGTVVTGANPVEALMQVKTSTTGKNFDDKFKKGEQAKEKSEAMVEFEKLYSEYLELEKKIKSGEKVEKVPEAVTEVPEEEIVQPLVEEDEGAQQSEKAVTPTNEELNSVSENVLQNSNILEIEKPDELSRSLVLAAEGDLSNLNIPPEHNGAFVQFKAEANEGGVIEGDLPEFDIVIKVGDIVTQQIHTEKGKGFASFTLPPSGGGRFGHGTDEEKRPYQFYTDREGKEVRIYFSQLEVDRSKPYFTANSFMVRRGGTWEKQTGGSSYTHEMKALMLQQGLMIEEKAKDPAVIQKAKEIEQILDKSKENIETVRLNRDQIRIEIEKNLIQLLEKAGDADPVIKKFDIVANGDTITINSKINIDTGFVARVNFDISVPIKDNGNSIELGKHNIEAGLATRKVKKKIEPNLPLLIPNINNYFENKYKKKIDSIRIVNGELILNFK